MRPVLATFWLFCAEMPFEIVLAPEAVEDFRSLKANVRANVRDGLEIYLRDEPARTSRSRIKRLRGLRRPQYRLRIDQGPRILRRYR